MPFASGTGEVAFRWTLSGDAEEQIHTMGFYALGGSELWADLEVAGQSIALEFANSFFPAGAADIGELWTYVGYRITAQTSDLGLVTQEYPVGIVGTGSGSSYLPVNCTSLTKKLTGVGGRANRGRFYMPLWFAREGDVTNNGVLAALVVSTKQSQCDDWLLAIDTANVAIPAILHADASPATQITSLVFDSMIATQRRRLRP